MHYTILGIFRHYTIIHHVWSNINIILYFKTYTVVWLYPSYSDLHQGTRVALDRCGTCFVRSCCVLPIHFFGDMFGYCLGIILFNHITKYNLKKTLETRESLAMLPTLPIFPLKKRRHGSHDAPCSRWSQDGAASDIGVLSPVDHHWKTPIGWSAGCGTSLLNLPWFQRLQRGYG